MDKTTLVKIFFTGMMTMFFAVMALYFFLGSAGRERENAKSTYKMSGWAMVWMSISVFVPFFADYILEISSLHVERCYTLLDMMAFPCLGGAMYAVVRSKCTRTLYMAMLQLPVAVGLVWFAYTDLGYVYWLTVTYAVTYALLMYLSTFIFVADYQRKLKNTFSNTKKRNLRWFHIFTTGLVLQALLWITLDAENSDALMKVIYYALSLGLWTWYGYQLSSQNFNIQAIDLGLDYLESNEEEIDPKQMWRSYADMEKAIFEYCVGKRNFIRPDLEVTDLIQELGITRASADAFFNEFGMSFNDYINNARTAYVEMLLSATDLNEREIAKKAGFERLSTMRSCFKKKYDCLPEEYRMTIS